jgi:hypothetical protein
VRIAPSGRAATLAVETPGVMSQGTLAPGVAVTAPMFARIHSVHRSKGAMVPDPSRSPSFASSALAHKCVLLAPSLRMGHRAPEVSRFTVYPLSGPDTQGYQETVQSPTDLCEDA